MAVIDLTSENFRETYTKNEIVVIDFWAVWCGPCHAFAPVFEEVAEEFPDVVFGKVDTEAEQDIASHFGIRSVPTVMIIRESLELFFQPGGLSGDDLRQLVQQAKDVDMDEVRKKIEEEDSFDQ